MSNLWKLIAVAFGAVLIACQGSPPKSGALEEARRAFKLTRDDPLIARAAAPEIEQAQLALRRAEHVWLETHDEATTSHLAYLAYQRAVLARNVGLQRQVEERLQRAALDAGRTRVAEQVEPAKPGHGSSSSTVASDPGEPVNAGTPSPVGPTTLTPAPSAAALETVVAKPAVVTQPTATSAAAVSLPLPPSGAALAPAGPATPATLLPPTEAPALVKPGAPRLQVHAPARPAAPAGALHARAADCAPNRAASTSSWRLAATPAPVGLRPAVLRGGSDARHAPRASAPTRAAEPLPDVWVADSQGRMRITGLVPTSAGTMRGASAARGKPAKHLPLGSPLRLAEQRQKVLYSLGYGRALPN